jgi:hypothetical protein
MKTFDHYRTFKFHLRKIFVATGCLILFAFTSNLKNDKVKNIITRKRISINNSWRFFKYDSIKNADNLIYDVRPESRSYRDGKGGDSKIRQVSSYELYAVDFGSSPDKVFRTQDQNPYVAGQFVWTGWDYLDEPTP